MTILNKLKTWLRVDSYSKYLVIGLLMLAIVFPLRVHAADLIGASTTWVMNILIFVLLMYLLSTILSWVMTWLIGLLGYFIGYNNFINNDVVVWGWTFIRDLCNNFFIVFLLIIAVATILRIESYSYKRLLAKIILVAILINFSRMITGLLIDVSQIITLTFSEQIKSAANSLAAYFTTGSVSVGGVKDDGAEFIATTISDFTSLKKLFGTNLLALIFYGVGSVIIGIFVLMLIARIFVLWILTILSPFAFLLSLLPSAQQYASQWWKTLTQYLLMGPAIGFFLYLAFKILDFNIAISATKSLTVKMFDNSTNAAIQASSYNWIDSGFTGGLLALVVMVVALMFVKQTGVIGAGLGSKALGLMQKYGTDLAKRGVKKAGYATRAIPQAKAWGQRYKQWSGPQISLGKDKDGNQRYANLKIGGRTWFNKEYREGLHGMADVKALSNPTQLGLAKAEMQKQAMSAAKYVKENLGVGNGEDADNLLKSRKYAGDYYKTLGLLYAKANDKEYEGKPEEYASDIEKYFGNQSETTQSIAEDVIRGAGKAGGDRFAGLGHYKIQVDSKTGKQSYETGDKDNVKQARKVVSTSAGGRAIIENILRPLLKNNFASKYAIDEIAALLTSPGKIETLAKDPEGRRILARISEFLKDTRNNHPERLEGKMTAFGDDGVEKITDKVDAQGNVVLDAQGNPVKVPKLENIDIARIDGWDELISGALKDNNGKQTPPPNPNSGPQNAPVSDDLLKRMQELKSKEAVIREAANSDEYKDKTAYTTSNGEEIKYSSAVDLDFKDLHDYLDKLSKNPSALSEDKLRDAEEMYKTYKPLYDKGGDKESKDDNKPDNNKEDEGSKGNEQNNGEESGLEQALHVLTGSNEQLKTEFVNSIRSLKKTYSRNQDFTKTADDFKGMYTKLDAIKMILWKIKTNDKNQEKIFRNLGTKLDKFVLAAKDTEEMGKTFDADMFNAERGNIFENSLTNQGFSREDFDQVVQEINELKVE